MKIWLTSFSALALVIPASAFAAQANEQAADAPTIVTPLAPDPARVAVARKLMDQIMPPATRDQMMASIMTGMSRNMVGAMRGNPEIAASMDKLPGAQGVFDKFMERQIAASTQDLIAHLPSMLDAMAIAYARRFTLVQLNEMATFFATSTGQAYIAQSPTIMTDPDVGKWMNDLMTRSMQRMPGQMAELKAEIEALEKKKSGS